MPPNSPAADHPEIPATRRLSRVDAGVRARTPTPEERREYGRRGGAIGGHRSVAGLTAEELAERVERMNRARLAKQRIRREHGEDLDPLDPETRRRVAELGGKARMAADLAGMTAEQRTEFFRARGRAGGKASGIARQPMGDAPRRIIEHAKQLAAEIRARDERRDGPVPPERTTVPPPPAARARARRRQKPADALELEAGAIAVTTPGSGDPERAIAAGHDRKIKLPNSGRRGDETRFVKVLRGIAKRPVRSGFDLDGRVYRPGRLFDECELIEAAGGAARPIFCLECAGKDPAREPGQKTRIVWILWRLVGANWQEISRVSIEGRGWAELLAPTIEQLFAPPAASEDPTELCREILRMLDDILARCHEARERSALVSLLHDQLAARAAAADAE